MSLKIAPIGFLCLWLDLDIQDATERDRTRPRAHAHAHSGKHGIVENMAI